MGDPDDSRARKAYEALLRVSLLQPSSPKYQGFAENVREMALTNYNYTFSEGEEVGPHRLTIIKKTMIYKTTNI